MQRIDKIMNILLREFKVHRKPTVRRTSAKKNPFKTLITCLLSLRTQDKNTAKASASLFKVADTPQKIVKLPQKRLEKLIYSSGYYKNKAKSLKHVSKVLLEKYKGGGHWFNSLTHGITFEIDSTEATKLEARLERKLRRNFKLRDKPTDEYLSHIINAIETNILFVFNGNVMNKEGGLITNLPKDSCVEVPVFADYQGLHPQGGIMLSTVCQALNMSNIMVQKAAVEGVIELDREKIYHAVLLDPNTASVCSPKEVRNVIDEMFEAEKQWLPKFD